MTNTKSTDFFRDPSRWDGIKLREGDIIIGSCYKSGTTLTQQIINLLLKGPGEFPAMRLISPWVESTQYAPDAEQIESLPNPRFLKTHLPFSSLPYSPLVHYIYLGRDGRDVGLSLYHHCRAMAAESLAGMDNGAADFAEFWDEWVETGKPRWDYWENIADWWPTRHLPNVLFMHYADLVADKERSAEKIARFLGCPWSAEVASLISSHSSLGFMKGLELAGKFGSMAKDKTETALVNIGGNGRWKNLLTAAQVARYHEIVRARLEPSCALWLAEGGDLPSNPNSGS